MPVATLVSIWAHTQPARASDPGGGTSCRQAAKLQLANVSCHKVDLSWPDTFRPCCRISIPSIFWCTAWARRRFYRSGAPGGSQRPRCATEVPVKQLIFLSSLQAPPHERRIICVLVRPRRTFFVKRMYCDRTSGRNYRWRRFSGVRSQRDMVYNLPVLTPPRWVRSRTRPSRWKTCCTIWWRC